MSDDDLSEESIARLRRLIIEDVSRDLLAARDFMEVGDEWAAEWASEYVRSLIEKESA